MNGERLNRRPTIPAPGIKGTPSDEAEVDLLNFDWLHDHSTRPSSIGLQASSSKILRQSHLGRSRSQPQCEAAPPSPSVRSRREAGRAHDRSVFEKRVGEVVERARRSHSPCVRMPRVARGGRGRIPDVENSSLFPMGEEVTPEATPVEEVKAFAPVKVMWVGEGQAWSVKKVYGF